MPPIPWEIIIPILIDLIADCFEENVPEAEVQARISDLGPIATFRVGRSVRKAMKLDRAQWRSHGPAIMAEIRCESAKLTAQDIEAIMDEVRDA
jgi:hypothetical protein